MDWSLLHDAVIIGHPEDQTQAESLYAHLAQAGLRVWMESAPRSTDPSHWSRVEEALNTSSAILILWGPHRLEQEQWRERDLAYCIRQARHDFLVLYVLLPGTQPPLGTWANIESWVCFQSTLDEPENLAHLIIAVRRTAPAEQLRHLPGRRASTERAIQHDVVISYNRADRAQVEVLSRQLAEAAGLRVWLDTESEHPGESWWGELEEAMLASSAVLLTWGAHDFGQVQRRERDLAYAIREAWPGFTIVYVHLPGSPLPQFSWANVDTWVRFEHTLDEPDTFSRVVAAIKREAPPSFLKSELPGEPAPYRGLEPFRVEDARFFFGRTAETEEMLQRLRRDSFVAVIGASGCGKTSLVRAGLLARLRGGALPGSADWQQVEVRPGSAPWESLAQGLGTLAGPTTQEEDFAKTLAQSEDAMSNWIAGLVTAGRQVVLVVDRFEEVFTLCRDEGERARYIAALLHLVRHPQRPAWVVLTLRADFFGDCARYPAWVDELVAHQFYLKAPSVEGLAAAIGEPAAQVGAIFEKGLSEQVQADVGDPTGRLPLLEHTLNLLWQGRRGRWLTWECYRQIDQVDGAICFHADGALARLSPDEREIARRIFSRLVWIGPAEKLAGWPRPKKWLLGQFAGRGAAERVLQRLVEERLVIVREGDWGGENTVHIIHEALLDHWLALREWIRKEGDFYLWRQRHLEPRVEEWQKSGSGLLRNDELARAEVWRKREPSQLGPAEQLFIAASVQQREEERKHRERQVRLLSRLGLEQRFGFILIGLVVIIAALVLYLLLSPREQARMTGDFRVAVAGFVETGHSGDPELGKELADGVYLRLQQWWQEQDTGFIVTVWGPERVGAVQGADREEQARSAERLASDIGADMLVYGTIDTSQATWQVAPEFYVSAENFHEAQEIVGQHELGRPFPLSGQGNIASRIELSDRLAARTRILSQITLGLAYFSVQRFDRALEAFQAAETVTGWDEQAGQQVLYLLLGNSAAKMGDLDRGEAYLRQALALDPEYARPLVTLAGIQYLRALKPFGQTNNPSDVDASLLDQAEATYWQASRASHQPALSDIPTKVHFGLGQCELMRAYSGHGGSYETAAEEFRAVIAAYGDGTNPRLRELAAESHARLGLIHDLSGHPDEAAEEYQAAAALLEDNPTRQALYTNRMQELRSRSGPEP